MKRTGRQWRAAVEDVVLAAWATHPFIEDVGKADGSDVRGGSSPHDGLDATSKCTAIPSHRHSDTATEFAHMTAQGRGASAQGPTFSAPANQIPHARWWGGSLIIPEIYNVVYDSYTVGSAEKKPLRPVMGARPSRAVIWDDCNLEPYRRRRRAHSGNAQRHVVQTMEHTGRGQRAFRIQFHGLAQHGKCFVGSMAFTIGTSASVLRSRA